MGWVRARCVSAALLAVMVLLTPLSPADTNREEIARRQAAMRKAGQPVTLKELDAYYADVPKEKNAARIYTQAFAMLAHADPPLYGNGGLPPRGKPLSDDARRAVERFLVMHTEAVNLLHEAAKLKRARYDVDLTNGFAVLLPHLAQARKAARVLALEALYSVASGDAWRAAQCVRSIVALAESLENEPLIISQLVRIACHDLALDTLERTLSLTELPEKEREKLAATLATAEPTGGMRRALIGERAVGNAIFGASSPRELALLVGDRPGLSDKAAIKAAKALGWWEADHLAYLRTMSDLIEIMGSAPPMRVKLIKAFNMRKQVEALPKHCRLTRMIIPALDRAGYREMADLARLRAARTALAVEAFRADTGALPGKLDALTPDYIKQIPADPFDGKPLRYEKREKGYVVYSLGPNMYDDVGMERAGAHEDYDITFVVER